MKVIVGLGNPGIKYKLNRHNTGHMAVDAFCGKYDLIFEKKNRLYAEIAVYRQGDEKNLIIKPVTYMNLSGKAVAGILQYYKLEPEQVLVIYDDFHLPLGTLRLRRSGSSGGHNGLASIIQETGISSFNRLRVGIGTDSFQLIKACNPDYVTHFVLSDFVQEERSCMEGVIKDVIGAAELFFEGDIKRAMNRYNKKVKEPEQSEANSAEAEE